MTNYLIVGDLDQIQSYVFASSRLPAIRGASVLLENTTSKFVENEDKNKVEFLRWKGGQVVAILKDASEGEALSFCHELEKTLRRASGGLASITTDFVEYDSGKFPENLKAVFRKVHDEKDSRESYKVANAALLTSPYYHRCNYLPTQSAIGYKSYEDEEGRYVSKAADIRLQAVTKEGKAEFDRSLLKEMGLNSKQYHLPYKLDDMFKSEEGGYMGFIAADGNSIGQMLEVIDTPKLYKEFSEEMCRLAIEAIGQAAKQTGICENGRMVRGEFQYVPLIPVIVAGDDMSFIVRAEDALHFAQALCEQFAVLSQKKKAIQKVIKLFCNDTDYQVAARQLFPDCFIESAWKEQRLTLSAGVAIAKRKFPISVYRRLAGELRDEAKKSLREHPQYIQKGGVIDFAVITTPTVQSLTDLRDHYSLDAQTKLTMRPYSLNAFQYLQKLTKLLKQIPRNKRKYLYTELFSNSLVGQVAFQFVMAKEEEKTRDDIFRAMQKICNSKGGKLNKGEAFCDRGDWEETLLIDALEIAELSEMGS